MVKALFSSSCEVSFRKPNEALSAFQPSRRVRPVIGSAALQTHVRLAPRGGGGHVDADHFRIFACWIYFATGADSLYSSQLISSRFCSVREVCIRVCTTYHRVSSSPS